MHCLSISCSYSDPIPVTFFEGSLLDAVTEMLLSSFSMLIPEFY